MRTIKITVVLLCAVLVCAVPVFCEAIKVVEVPAEVDQYGLFRVEITLPYIEGNTHVPEVISLTAKITTPDGKAVNVPAFCTFNSKKKGISTWEVRYTPVNVGVHMFYMEFDSPEMQDMSEISEFSVKRSLADGFLSRSENNPFYLVFDSGEPFFGIGHNVGWVHNNSPSVYDRYFKKLESNKCNMTRIWLCSWSFPVEWERLGVYSHESLGKLDEVIETAASRGIYIILCLDTYGNLMKEKGTWNEGRWNENPYNAANGGPCAEPGDLFTSPEAKKFYREKVRYLVSRYGYSPNILAFELWNEYNAPVAWIKEMAQYIRSVNPHGQMVTTSMGYPYGKVFDESSVWKLKEIDIVALHEYGNATSREVVPSIVQGAHAAAFMYSKPLIFSEFGIDFGKEDKDYDPGREGMALHNSLWASAMSGAFATAMNWWWDSYIRPNDLYYHYRGISYFLKGTDWDSQKVGAVDIGPIRLKGAIDEENVRKDVTIVPEDKWKRIGISEFIVQGNGDLAGGGMPNRYLHGSSKKKLQVEQKFSVEYPMDGKFVIRVGTVSQAGYLRVTLDGKTAYECEFSTGPGDGPWKRSMQLKKENIYQCVYDKEIEIDVPPGSHSITLSNTGKDWIGIEKITLKGYIDPGLANARCIGMTVGDEMLLWVQNKESNWRNALDGIEPGLIKGAVLEVNDLADGRYRVEWWDTYRGDVIHSEDFRSKDGTMHIDVPEFRRDLACKVRQL